MNSNHILKVENLYKKFGGLLAVNNCSLKIKKGTASPIRALAFIDK